MDTAVLFLVFNRPDTTCRTFETIRQARPSRLYVAADGHRDGKSEEKERCLEVRKIATSVDWPCDVFTLFQENNLGCKFAVSTGINWFFEHEEEGIILEDDVLPDPSFFAFCEELLERYRFEPKIAMISGNCFYGSNDSPNISYWFSKYPHVWGWATWRRAWQQYDINMQQWPELRETDWLLNIGNGHKNFVRYWKYIFDTMYMSKIDTWDYQWVFSLWLHNCLSIAPYKNLVKNIGFGKNATHTKTGGGWIAKLCLESMSFPLRHPTTISQNQASDRWEDLHLYSRRHLLLLRIKILLDRYLC